MWSSRIFCLAGRASNQVSPLSSHLSRRTFLSPATLTSHHLKNNDAPNSTANNNSANMNIPSTRPILSLNGPISSYSPFQETRRFMSKFLSKSAAKRLPLNTKRAKKGYYKGKGCTSEGRLTSKGKFIADPLKKLQLVVPDLEGFALKPYIARTISKFPPEDRRSVGPSP